MKKKILLLASNPRDTRQLRLDEEAREIDEGLRRAQRREQFELTTRWAVRVRDLQRALLDVNPQIVHFSGHGRKSGIVLEDDAGRAVLVPREALAGLFELFKEQVECVLFNACLSEPQARAVHAHIDCVIGMTHEVGDRAALEFAVGFYDALGAGRDYETAFKLGRNAIQLHGLPEHQVPVIFFRAHTAPAAISTPVSRKNSTDVSGARENDGIDNRELVEALLQCRNMRDRHTRDDIVGELPADIRNNIPRRDADRPDVMNIVRTCRNYEGGLGKLIEILEGYEGDSQGMRGVKALVG